MEEALIKTISQYASLPEEEIPLVLSNFELKKYKRGETLLQSGKVAHEVFFVVKGTLHQFYIDESGNERSCNFTFENEFVTDLESFSHQTCSASNIKTLEPSICYVISCLKLVALLKASSAMSKMFRITVENIAAESIRRTKSLLSFSPEKQFLELIETKPEILQRIPQRYIAQYLGIAPESLSRIRKRMMTAAKS
ncbi:MAG: Crp/Fnr family transcriptional regulator [Niabella sp.]